MKIGVFFNAKKSGGGAYQYAITFLEALKKRERDDFIIFNASPDLPAEFRNDRQFKIIELSETTRSFKMPPLLKLADHFIHESLLRGRLFGLLNFYDKTFRNKKLIAFIKGQNLDLMIFTSPYVLAAQLPLPTIVPIHDVQHKLQKRFPEMNSGRPYLNKEYICSQITKHANVILVDSEIGKADVLACYKIKPAKIAILPFLPPDYLIQSPKDELIQSFKKRYNLPERFLFYPAQFWPHKNHINLVKALAFLKKEGITIDLVLTGGQQNKWGVYKKIMEIADERQIRRQLHFLGYVENEEISMLYKLAAALIMPTFLGPTNIPVLEAWQMGCPVLYSAVRGCREQAGDAALLFNPFDPSDIADKIKTLWQNENLRRQLIANGKNRLRLWTKQKFIDRINELIKQYEK